MSSDVWLCASYACHSFHYRMPETVAISSINPAMPSPLTVKMALIASYLRTGDIASATQVFDMFPLEVRVRPSKGAIVYRSIMRYVRPPKDSSKVDGNTGSSYTISPHFREFALLAGQLEVYVKTPEATHALITEALEHIPYFGAKDSLVTCMDVQEITEPPRDCVSMIDPDVVVGDFDMMMMQFADFDASAFKGKNRITLESLIPSQRNKKHYQVNSYVVPARQRSQGNVKILERSKVGE